MEFTFSAPILAVLVFTVAGIMDYFYREIDPEVWIIPAPVAAVLGFSLALGSLPQAWYLPYMINGLIVAIVGVMYKLDLIGGADFAALAFLSLSLPVVPGGFLPSTLIVVVYAAPFMLLYYGLSLLRVCGLSCLLRGKARVKGRFLVEHLRWWMPVGARIKGDPHEVIAEMGVWDEEIDASPLLPLVTLIWLGLLAALLLGDKPLVQLLKG